MSRLTRQAAWAAFGLATFSGCGGDDPVTRLARATPSRLVEPRLSGPFQAAGCGPAGDPCLLPAVGTRPFAALERATLDARRQAAAGVPRAEHAEALAEVLWGAAEPALLDRAERLLLGLVAERPDDASLLSDLAAVHLVRTAGHGRARDAARALDFADRALARAPGHEAALFNRALALQELGVVDAADDAWGSYLEVDPGSSWSDVARARRAALEEAEDPVARGAPTDADPRALRELAMDSLLPAWGRAYLAGSQAAEGWLARADSVGRGLHDRSVGILATDVLRAVAEGRGRPMARALAAYGRARAAYLGGDDSSAGRALEVAWTEAGPASPLLQDWCQLWLASIDLGTSLSRVRERTSAILGRRSADETPSLVGLAAWVRGVAEGREGASARALRDHEAAVDAMERAGEASYSAFLWTLVAEDRVLLGDPAGAWEARARAFTVSRVGRDSLRYQASLLEAAEALRREGLVHAALRLQEASIAAAPSTAPPNLMAEALARRARLRGTLGDSSGARTDLVEARRLAEVVEDSVTRLRTLSDVWRASAAVDARRVDPSVHVLARLDSAVAIHERRGESFFLRDLHLDRSTVRARRAEWEAARADLRSSLDHLERGRDARGDAVDAVGFAGTASRLVDAALELELVATWNPWAALETLERVRSIAIPWVDAPSRLGPGPHPLLPEGVAVVTFATLEDRLVAWVLRSDGGWAVAYPGARVEVEAMAQGLQEAARVDRGEGVPRAAERLTRVLFPDTVQSLVGDRDLVVVPDHTTAGLPFGVLRDGDGWWIEERSVSVSPSVVLALASQAPAQDDGGGVLLAGDPAVGESMVLRFPPLDGARREVEALQGLYAGAEAIVGSDLTAAALMERLARPLRLLHFAGHAVATPEFPGASQLVLSPSADGREPGLLLARDLANATVRGPAVVVLTACQTVTPAPTIVGGFQGLALPFLRHGTRAVVGTLWPVEDQATARFAVLLHERLSEGAAPAEALRGAQAEALRTGDVPVSVWAAFQVVVAGIDGAASVEGGIP